jgi:hypothetical protein
MHDLNDALDDLRSVIPYAHGPSVRKLSKIATLLLAKNFIMMQNNIIEELRKEVAFYNHASSLSSLPTSSPLLSQTIASIDEDNKALFEHFASKKDITASSPAARFSPKRFSKDMNSQ